MPDVDLRSLKLCYFDEVEENDIWRLDLTALQFFCSRTMTHGSGWMNPNHSLSRTSEMK